MVWEQHIWDLLREKRLDFVEDGVYKWNEKLEYAIEMWPERFRKWIKPWLKQFEPSELRAVRQVMSARQRLLLLGIEQNIITKRFKRRTGLDWLHIHGVQLTRQGELHKHYVMPDHTDQEDPRAGLKEQAWWRKNWLDITRDSYQVDYSRTGDRHRNKPSSNKSGS